MTARLAELAEEHVRAALQRAEAGFPAFHVDSWSDPAVPGQWVLLEDDEGRRLQAEMRHVVSRGVPLRPGSLARSCERLAEAVLAELRVFVAGGPAVSRPLPDPEAMGAHCAHVEFKGVWLRLTAGPDPEGRPVAVLAGLLGRPSGPLAEPVEEVHWL